MLRDASFRVQDRVRPWGIFGPARPPGGKRHNVGIEGPVYSTTSFARQKPSLMSSDSKSVPFDMTPPPIEVAAGREPRKRAQKMCPLTSRFSLLPVRESSLFTTTVDDQEGIDVFVMEEKHERASRYEVLRRFP